MTRSAIPDLSTRYVIGPLSEERILSVHHLNDRCGQHRVGITDTTADKVRVIDLSLAHAEELGFALIEFAYKLASRRWKHKDADRYRARLEAILDSHQAKETP